MQIVSDLCEAANTLGAGQIYDYVSTPNNQYASFTIHTLVPDGGAATEAQIYIRYTDTNCSFQSSPSVLSAYTFRLYSSTGGYQWFLYAGSEGLIGNGSLSTVSVGDVFTFAALGTTLYAFQNSTQLFSMSDATYASGLTALGITTDSTSTAQFSGFAMGSVTLGIVTTSTFSPASGAVAAGSHITVSNADSALSGFAEYFTTDGTVPTISSTPYSGPITLGTLPETIKVLAVATGYTNSAIASATYTLKSSKPPTHPVFGTAPSRFNDRITAGHVVGSGGNARIKNGE